MAYSIINKISSSRVPAWGNKHQFIAIHYLGCVGENYDLASDGCGAHYTIYYDGTIYQRCSHDAIVWAVGTGGYYTQKHPYARNANTISIEMCVKYDGAYNRYTATENDKEWYFTKETQEACVWLVQKLMKELNIPIENVLRHNDIVSKGCPAPYVLNNKRKTSWTWDEFKAKVSGTEVKSDPLYRVRKSWEDSKSQIFAGTLNGAKENCPVGYSVYDENGKSVYSNATTIDDNSNSDKIWLGWVKRESGASGFRQTNGDNGHAFGKYQFDTRYALVPFMKYCVEYNRDRYSVFNTFIKYGAGSDKLVGNNNLASVWNKLCDSYPAEFELLQDTYAYNYYYLEAKKYIKNLYGISMDKHSPAVKGTLFSMAIRSGSLTGAKNFSGCTNNTSELEMLRISYSRYGNADANRWTKAGQWGDAIKALNDDTYTLIYKEMKSIDESEKAENISTPKEPSNDEISYYVGTSWKDGKCVSQVGAYISLTNAKKEAKKQTKVKKINYYVFNKAGKKVYAAKYTATTTFEPYNVRVNIPNLRIRKTPNGDIVKSSGKEVYTGIGVFGITEEKKSGGYTWGKLLSGNGWIAVSSEYVEKIS